MRRIFPWLIALVALVSCPMPAHAGAYADKLSQCLIHATTPADRKVVVRWAFATMALDPDVASMAAVSPAQREAINQQAGTMVTDLLAGACSRPVQHALMFEGVNGAKDAFEAWARWAITGIAAEPHVMQGAGALLQYLDIGKLMPLVPLQGLPPASG
ncbi:MAG TPA: hypothetical protein VHA71_03925 [Rhodanobacteraceae bacterium]|jgi:hypothetical protein|nr:hypothetical protein [Rhodanobacteraceae bacterium]